MAETSQIVQKWVVRAMALLIGLGGLLVINRPLLERVPDRYEQLVMPFAVEFAGRSLDLVVGIALLYLALQLSQRKLVAWWLTVGALIILFVTNAIVVRHPLVAAYFAVLLGALVFARNYFRARSEPQRVRWGLLVLSASVLFALSYGTFGFYLMDQRDFGMSFDMFGSIIHSVRAYALLGNADLLPHTRHARWFLRSLSLLGASSLLFGLYSLFRPIAYRYRELPHERSRAAKFVVEHSASTDDYFKLWPHDKTYYFAADASAMLAYGVAADTAIVIGDPVGTAAGIDRIVPEFDSVCVTHGWAPSYMYVAQTNRSAYEAAGYELVKVGEDAVVNLTEFANHTARNKHFRNIRNRFEKAGYTTQFIAPPHAESLIADLTLVSDDWLRSPNRKEWKFLTGFFSRQYIASTPVFVVRDANGAIQAFANLIPVYTPSASTIDLMRHFRQAPNNAMDYLLYSLMLHLQQQGIKTFNMGLAPLAGLGGDEARPEERLLNLLYRTRQSYVSFQGLRQFKGKFEPIWEPKYMAYRSNIGTLPRIAYALNKLMRN